MVSLLRSSGNQRWFGVIMLGIVCAGVSPGVAGAKDRFVVLEDGQRVPLVESRTEFAVTFDGLKAIDAAARRLAAQGRGIVESAPDAKHSRIRLLRVADTSSCRRDLVREDHGVLDVRPVYRIEGAQGLLLSTGTINVKLESGLSDEEREDLWRTYRLEVVEPIEGLEGVYSVKPIDDDDEVFRAQVLAADHRTLWSQPNFRQKVKHHQAVPNDEFFAEQWYLDDAGQLGGGISATGAWRWSEGQDVLIGMFDDACDVDHEDLAGNYIDVGQDPILEATEAGEDDPRPKQFGDKHGTAVMGLAVARANRLGIRGVANLSRFTVSRGWSDWISDQQVASVYRFARQLDVDVHINSWGYGWEHFNPAIVVDAIQTAFEQGRDPDGEEGEEEPLGMVIVFASGNGGENPEVGDELAAGKSLAVLPSVIGVGASTIDGQVAGYSNFGSGIDVLAPGGDKTNPVVTVDNDDEYILVDDGYNVGGFTSSGETDLDSEGRYTRAFYGTSASCPLAAGVAALVLSANPLLTATEVRLILEHTADRIKPDEADYDNVTGRSNNRYSYGRVNAEAAVLASIDALTVGAWPDRVVNARVEGGTLRWRAGVGTHEFLVLESPGGFNFTNDPENRFPQDLLCYSVEQLGCADANTAPFGELPVGITITSVVRCEDTCEVDDELEQKDVDGSGSVAYAVYARNAIGRYSWGVEATVSGETSDTDDSGTNGGSDLGPKVTIMASITEGVSPLTVTFTGNAQRTNADIDETRTQWDFDLEDGVLIDATTRNATHTYEVLGAESRTFIARLTIYDVDGIPGSAQIAIRVQGSGATDGNVDPAQSSVRIIVGIPGTVDSDVGQGVSPFDVQLSIDASGLVGTPESVFWDLGDGTTATSIVVPHQYINETDVSLRIPITATVTTQTASMAVQTVIATKVLTILPGSPPAEPPDIQLPGAGTQGATGGGFGACGALGMLPLSVVFASMVWLRLRRY